MKTTILRALLAAACLAATAPAQAQWSSYRPVKSLFLIGWGLAQPLGDLEDYQTGTSVAGMSLEFRSTVKPRISVGLAFDYNRFEHTSFETVQKPGNAVLSGPAYRYADQFGIKVTFHGYLLDGPLRPYGGVGIGGDWSYAYVQSADLASTESGFHFLVTPEVGLIWQIVGGGTSVALNVAVRYNYSTASFQNVDNAQWLSEVIGITASY